MSRVLHILPVEIRTLCVTRMNHHPIRKRIFFPGGISGKFINPKILAANKP